MATVRNRARARPVLLCHTTSDQSTRNYPRTSKMSCLNGVKPMEALKKLENKVGKVERAERDAVNAVPPPVIAPVMETRPQRSLRA